ncbi:MAG: hypothetical protein KKF46_02240 [Nanoarchaeota archaeon]|nr:hypothetical protein [Nanoarchaeota archaeon]MBU1321154.1 hypothetical protein [Nanoarchaeota archaeon]MBU1597483.1 hypothetical protein [Nanoarchaeota archaeon]MBU2441857.1 hypothetical protein [Nanoarchaeota archaeon]
MVKQKKAQAAFEYLTTYGWAILTALVVVGALSYFGFLNPSNLLPNKCDFGNQMECVEYRIVEGPPENRVDLWLRNNFGKDIEIMNVEGIEIFSPSFRMDGGPPNIIPVGNKREFLVNLDEVKRSGEKQEINLVIRFRRAGGAYPEHNVSGTVFVTVQ